MAKKKPNEGEAPSTPKKGYFDEKGTQRTLLKGVSWEFIQGSLVVEVEVHGKFDFQLELPLLYKPMIPTWDRQKSSVMTQDHSSPEDDPEIESIWVGMSSQSNKPDMILILFKEDHVFGKSVDYHGNVRWGTRQHARTSSISYFFEDDYWDEKDRFY